MNEAETIYQAGVVEHRAGRLDAAEALYVQALNRDRTFARAWHLWGLVLHQRGDTARGIEYVERAIGLEPQWPVFYLNLGNIFSSVGRQCDAENVLRRGLAIAPHQAPLLGQLGHVMCALDRCDEAIACYNEALALNPRDAALLRGIGFAYSELGHVQESIAAYQRAAELSTDPIYRILAATQLPLVYESEADVAAWRKRLEQEVDALLAGGVQADITTQQASVIFDLPHQGLCDREIQRKVARLYRPPSLPPLRSEPRAGGKIRVGFISSYFHRHTIGKLTQGLITRLSHDDFHVTVYSVGRQDDEVAREIASSADRHVAVPRDLVQARQAVLANPVDVLVYTDIGMDPTTYTLAFSRLAPVQCVTWGHPETTGLDTIDYFVSSDAFEIADADAHYSERLVRLPSLTFYYRRAEIPAAGFDRAALGLDANARLYACPQSIYKFHPQFDAAIAAVLRGDPEGQVVLIRWTYSSADDLLRRRLTRVMPDVADRIVFVRRLQQPEFMNFLTLADVLLDPFPYGGGNSTLEGFSFGVPVVTLPTELLRGRITQAFCRRIGIEECIARNVDDYVRIALRLANDRAYRGEISGRILANQSRLFEDDSAVRDWEGFLRSVAPRGT